MLSDVALYRSARCHPYVTDIFTLQVFPLYSPTKGNKTVAFSLPLFLSASEIKEGELS